MKFIICNDYSELSKKAADIFAAKVKSDPQCTLGLATGSTPVGTYRELIERFEKGELDFSGVTTFNLDEYYPIDNSNPQSYHYFMQKNLFSHINIAPEKIHIPNGNSGNSEMHCKEYDAQLAENGGVDLMLLGIGENGHIGFNEPAEEFITGTHIVTLTENTIDANSRFFENRDEVPRQAISMGMASIIAFSKEIVLLASGKNKFNAVNRLKDDKITSRVPSTLLKLHPNVTVICDKAAYYGK